MPKIEFLNIKILCFFWTKLFSLKKGFFVCENFNISTNYITSVEAANLVLQYSTPIATHYCSLPLYTKITHKNYT
jgi:hypothetical protein